MDVYVFYFDTGENLWKTEGEEMDDFHFSSPVAI